MALRNATLICAASLALSCGGGTSTPQPSVLSVGGSYPTVATPISTNTCGDQVQNNVTTVTQTPGAQTLSLRHSTINATGTIDNTGRFSTTPTTLGDLTITIVGQFSATGFDATVTLMHAQPACQSTAPWVGTKNGPPNTYP